MRKWLSYRAHCVLWMIAGLAAVAVAVWPCCWLRSHGSGVIEVFGGIGEELGPLDWPARCGLWLMYAFILLLPLSGIYVIVGAVIDFRNGGRGDPGCT